MAQATVEQAALDTAPAAGSVPVRGGGLMSQLTRSRSGFAGMILVVLIVAMAVIAPIFVDETTSNTNLIWTAPSRAHLLGTNGSGQDIATMILLGGRTVIAVGFGAALLTTVIAVVVGALAAYFRGRFDG